MFVFFSVIPVTRKNVPEKCWIRLKSIPGFQYHTGTFCINNAENARVLRCLDIVVRIFYANTAQGRGSGDICKLHCYVSVSVINKVLFISHKLPSRSELR